MIGLIARPYPVTLVTATDFNAAFPGSNALNNDLGRVARATPAANTIPTIMVDLGSAKPVDVLGLLWHNLPAGVMRFRAANTQANTTANPIYDSGYVAAMTGATRRDVLTLFKGLITLPTVVTARYWLVEFDQVAGSRPAGRVLQASRLVIGKSAVFAIGPQKATLGAVDRNSDVVTEVGETRSQEDPQLIRPVAALSFSYAKLSEMEEVLGAYTLSLGTSKPMIVCTDLTSANLQDNLVFGKPEQVISHESDTYDVWSFEAVVPSIGP